MADAAIRAAVTDLCSVVPDRRPGGRGNESAVDWLVARFDRAGLATTTQAFPCMDWSGEPGDLAVGGQRVRVDPAPYGLPAGCRAPLRVVGTIDDLSRPELAGAIVVVVGELAAEPLTPMNYPFYGNPAHQRLLDALIAAEPAAVVAATGRAPLVAGAIDPFPLIEAPWYLSDHAIFAMRGRAAVAITCEPIVAAMEAIYHSAADRPERIDTAQVRVVADGLTSLIHGIAAAT